MEVNDTCPCGAQFYVTTKQVANAAFRHKDWLAAHEVCRERAAANPPQSCSTTEEAT